MTFIFVLRQVFDWSQPSAFVGGLAIGLAEWALLSAVYRRLVGGRLSDFSDADRDDVG